MRDAKNSPEPERNRAVKVLAFIFLAAALFALAFVLATRAGGKL